MSHTWKSLIVLTAFCPLSLLACVSTDPTAGAIEATLLYDQTAKNPTVKQNASEQLYEAQKAKERMERAMQRGSDEDDVDHFAYLLKRRTEIAQVVADERALQKRVGDLGKRRDQLRLDARTAETRQALTEAEIAKGVASGQREEIADLRERAQAAEEQVAAAQEQASAMALRLELSARETERGLVVTLGDVLFNTASSRLAGGASRTLDRVGELLREYPDRAVIIEGHTDDRGSDAYNEQLSRERAGAVADALVRAGLPRTRLEVRGLGESAPAVPNADASSRQQNRRVEIVLVPSAAR